MYAQGDVRDGSDGRDGGSQGDGYQQQGGSQQQRTLPRGVRFDQQRLAGKCFLGGLGADVTSEAVSAYCSAW